MTVIRHRTSSMEMMPRDKAMMTSNSTNNSSTNKVVVIPVTTTMIPVRPHLRSTILHPMDKNSKAKKNNNSRQLTMMVTVERLTIPTITTAIMIILIPMTTITTTETMRMRIILTTIIVRKVGMSTLPVVVV